jgi:biopolymer transport protein ExbD
MLDGVKISNVVKLEKSLKKYKVGSLVEIKAEKDVEYKRVVKVLDLLAKNNFTNITLVTKLE